MKEQNKTKQLVSRRKFIGTSATAAAAFSLTGLNYQCTTSKKGASEENKLNSTFGGVKIGAIIYAFRDIPGIDSVNSHELVIKACKEAGINEIELMTYGMEQWCGAPELINPPKRPEVQSAAGSMDQQSQILSEEEFKAQEKAAAESRIALRKWRSTAPMGKIEEYGRFYRNAGINVHAIKFFPYQLRLSTYKDWSYDEINYAFKAAKAIGAKGVTMSDMDVAFAQKIGPIAEKNGMLAIFHNHTEFAEEGFSIDPILAASPANRINMDIGHYFGSTGLHPNPFIEKYHDRIFSLHLKDKTGPTKEKPQGTNQVWGQGETPIADALLLIKEKKWPIYCDIELEYEVKPWKTSVQEVKTCVNYARQILL